MDSIKNSPILAGAGNSVEKASPVLMFPALSDFNLELCALAQAVTVGKEDVPAAIESFKSAVQSMIP